MDIQLFFVVYYCTYDRLPCPNYQQGWGFCKKNADVPIYCVLKCQFWPMFQNMHLFFVGLPKYCPAYLATSVQKVGIGNLHKDSRGDMKIWWVGVKSSCHYSKSLI